MDEKKRKKPLDLPQPDPDVVLPDNNTAPDFESNEVLRTPSPRSDIYRTAP